MLKLAGQKRTAADWLGKDEDPFDQWLERGLHEAFDAVAQEPIPDDILWLIDEDRDERERMRRRRSTKCGE
jgi:hypothetical protein